MFSDYFETRTSAIDFEKFNELFVTELEKIPAEFKQEVSQFVVEIAEKKYSDYMVGLYVLGQYQPRGNFGLPVVVLYFGSFKRAYPHMRVSDLQIEIGKTLAHELLHHWELRSGIDDLGDEDREKLLIWKEKTGNVKNASLGQNLIEIALYIYLIFILIAFLARVIR